MSVDREVRWLVDGALSDDPAMSLACLRILRDDYLPWVERRSVRSARTAGKDWAQIGRLMGRARQSVRERFGGTATLADLLPPSLPATDPELFDAERQAIMLRLRHQRDADDAAATGSLVPW